MGQDSNIEWTHDTLNLWWGCVAVHEGCDNCYAEIWSNRWNNDVWGNDKPRKEIASAWKNLAKFQRTAESNNEIRRVFVQSMGDIAEKSFPLIDKDGNLLPYKTGNLRDRLFKEIDEGKYPNLMFLFLSKRPSNYNKVIPEQWKKAPPQNVMFGTSPVNQATAHTLIPQLLQVNGKRFLSIEPMLDEIDLNINPESGECVGDPRELSYTERHTWLDHIHWVIVGGESGPKKRPFNIDWANRIRTQCYFWEVPFFFKQIDKVKPIPEEYMSREFYKN